MVPVLKLEGKADQEIDKIEWILTKDNVDADKFSCEIINGYFDCK